MGWIIKLIGKFFEKNPSRLIDASKLAKVKFGGPKDVVKWVGNNKLNAALLVPSLGSAGLAIAEFFENDPSTAKQVLDVIRSYRYEADRLEEGEEISVSDLSKYSDEFVKIRNVAALLGGRKHLADLISVINMDRPILELEAQVNSFRN